MDHAADEVSVRNVKLETEPLLHDLKPPKVAGFFGIMFVTAFNFAYGAIIGSMGLFILPVEAGRLFPAHESMALVFFVGVFGGSQLFCPLIGSITDHWHSMYGNRMPLFILASIIALSCSCGMKICSVHLYGKMFALILFIAMVALNALSTLQAGIVNDLVPVDKHGMASSFVAVQILLGSLLSSLFIVYFPDYNDGEFQQFYDLYVLMVSVCVMSVLSVALRRQSDSGGVFGGIGRHFSWNDAKKCYGLSEGSDFNWVLLHRTLYYMAVSCQTFMLLYLRDVAKVPEERRDETLGMIGFITQALAGVFAPIVGAVSDTMKTRKIPIYCAVVVMCISYCLFISAPQISAEGDIVKTLYYISALYGLANGSFLSVDYALALDCVPNPEDSCRDLGKWGVCAFIGTSLGPAMWGIAINCFPEGDYYGSPGYVIMLAGGCVCTILASLCLLPIKSVG